MSTNFYSPAHLDEALRFVRQSGDATILGGGTDLMIRIKNGRCKPVRLLDISNIEELKDIAVADSCCEIGAAVTFTELLADPRLGAHFPALFEACVQIGSKQIRNTATLGGNICNASPAADAVLALMAFGAEFVLVSPGGGSRVMKSEQFFTGPGKTVLQPQEILTIIRLPIAEPVSSKFLKIGRTAIDIATVGVAVALRRDAVGRVVDNTRIALAAVAPTPVNARRAVDVLLGHRLTPDLVTTAAQAAVEEISPIDDHRASRDYRRHLARALVEEALLGFMNDGLSDGRVN